MLGALIGVELGTIETKVLALALDGRVIASAEAAYPVETPEPGFVEQDANAVNAAGMQALYREYVGTLRMLTLRPM